MDIKGRIIIVHSVENGMSKSGKAWAKQSFVIETAGQYPKKIALTLWGEEKINQYDLQPGRDITAHLELESREYNGRWYTDVKAWKVEPAGAAGTVDRIPDDNVHFEEGPMEGGDLPF